jgi:glutathione synthase/RimK-type ligase-like ATP-grasp enzyme
MRLGFATSREDPALISDDRLACAVLERDGWQVEPVVWDAGADLGGLDALILRSCWDYHRKPEAFGAWLDELRVLPIPVLNPPEICTWNLHKRYLFELASRGVRVPETVLVPRGQPVPDVAGERVVVKPAISLNGEDTYLLAPGDPAVRALGQRVDLLVQEYIPEITEAGELSFVFFGGEFSHAIRKVPRSGEFRVQVEHGGTRLPVRPTEEQIGQATAILQHVDRHLLYARVDVVERGEDLVLIELELIDPMLFLGYAPGAPERFAAAVQQAVTGRR